MNEIAHLGVVQASAYVGRGADEPFNNEIGALLPIALCGRTSLPALPRIVLERPELFCPNENLLAAMNSE